MIKQSAFLKSALREIKLNKSRFVSIFAIAAIGISFFGGIKATQPDMVDSSNMYYSRQKLMDVRIVSVNGFTDDDLETIGEQTSGTVVGSHYADREIKFGKNESVARIYSLSKKINVPEIVKGRLPKKANECVADANSFKAKLKVGDTIAMTDDDGDDAFRVKKLKVVGLVNSAMYISGTQYGTTNLGTGQIGTVIFVKDSAFSSSRYNQAYVYCDFLRKYDCYSDEYDDAVKDVVSRLKSVQKDRYDNICSGNYDYRKLGLEKFDSTLASSVNSVYDAKDDLENQYDSLVKTKNYLDMTNGLIENLQEKLNITNSDMDAYTSTTLKGYKTQLDDVNVLKNDYETALKKCNDDKAALKTKNDELTKKKESLAAIADTGSEEYTNLNNEINTLTEEIKKLNTDIPNEEKDVAKKKKAYEKANSKYNSSYSKAKSFYDSLNDSNVSTSAELASAKQTYSEELADYNAMFAAYSGAKEQLDAQMKQVVESVSSIFKKYGQVWFFSDRNDLPAYAEYSENSERIGNIGKVFPVFFLLVAMLVCLTTMTRMVDEQRTEIGVLKALGYTDASVTMRYLGYALAAALAGCVVGLCVGFILFPQVIIRSYSILYKIPVISTPFRGWIALWSSALMLSCITVAVFAACRKEFSNAPSELMIAKAPPIGKRILLERIGFVWKRLSFAKKVTARNIFRYKKRMLMTVVGVAGCTALLLTGFGLYDSVTDIINLQFSKVWNYDATVGFSSEKDSDRIMSNANVDYLRNYLKVCDVKTKKGSFEVNLLVPEYESELNSYVSLKSRTSNAEYKLSDSGCILTEKIAKKLGVSIGDKVTLVYDDNINCSVDVTGIVENYAYHYMYISPAQYNNITGNDPQYNSALCKLNGRDGKEFSRNLLKNSTVMKVVLNNETRNNFSDIVQILDLVVIVLIVSAAALAFIVLYNLTNINITERKREIATLKVLGFRRGEVTSYIFRENIILTLIGTAVGLILGYFLAMFVITTAEIDIVMFGRSIHWLSYVISSALTIVFSLLVSLFMRKKLDNVEMVESLKSVE